MAMTTLAAEMANLLLLFKGPVYTGSLQFCSTFTLFTLTQLL